MIFPRFVFPAALLLLILIPWSIWLGTRIRSLSTPRKWTAIALRVVILLCLIGALAGAELVKKSGTLAVFFILDHSNSITEEQKLAAEQWVRNSSDAFMTKDDKAGVIVFGENASIELSVAEKLGLRKVTSYVGGDQSDLAGAIRLALAAFPQGAMRRIVLYTDGNETRGSVLEEVKYARATGAEVSVVPIAIESGEEVRIREVSAPSRANTDEPFQLRVVVESKQDAEATLRLFQRVGSRRRMLPPQKVTLQKGVNTFLLTQEVTQGGFYEYEARIESEADTIMANNEGRAFTVVHGEPTVLYVESDPEHSRYLEPALVAEGINVSRINPAALPKDLAQLQNYDAIILSDVSSTDLSMDHLQTIETAVHDLGIGLIMIGGPDSFGAGGYLDTPIEKALPVDMDVKQRKVMPKGALILIMHTVEIPDGNVWARDIGIASLNVLSPLDLMGALGYMGYSGRGDDWIFPLSLVGDGQAMRQAIIKGSANIGDMPAVGPTLKMAYNALVASDAAAKRIVLISDGDPAAPPRSLVNKLSRAGIPVSTICIAPHSPQDQKMLSWIAESTGGQFYYVTNANNLPLIFSKEASVVTRSMLIEKEFTPRVNHKSELLYGLDESVMPPLLGYVVTSPKDNATVPLLSPDEDPILAHWRYGLGKSVAFTSDVTNRWAPEWLRWEGFDRFWAQTVRWATRALSPSDFQIDTHVRDGMGHVRIDAVDKEGRFINYLKPRAVVTGPGPDFERTDVDLMQTGPGIYEGAFPVDESGVYMLNLLYTQEDGSQGMVPTGLALNYSREYEYDATNLPLLEQIVHVGAGKMMEPTDNPFEHNLQSSPAITPIWHVLALVAACLFPVEIFVRRVVVDFRILYRPIIVALRKIPPLRTIIPSPSIKPAAVTGAYAVGRAKEHRYDIRKEGLPSFGLAHEPPAVETRPALNGETDEQKAPGQTEYTQKLLAAKERALAGKRRKSRAKNHEEDR